VCAGTCSAGTCCVLLCVLLCCVLLCVSSSSVCLTARSETYSCFPCCLPNAVALTPLFVHHHKTLHTEHRAYRYVAEVH
jgi:hypothetical protein